MMNRSIVVALSLTLLSLVACSASTESTEGVRASEAAVTTAPGDEPAGDPAPGDTTSPSPDTTEVISDEPTYGLGSRCTSGASACIGKQAGDSCGGSKKCKNAPICTCA